MHFVCLCSLFPLFFALLPYRSSSALLLSLVLHRNPYMLHALLWPPLSWLLSCSLCTPSNVYFPLSSATSYMLHSFSLLHNEPTTKCLYHTSFYPYAYPGPPSPSLLSFLPIHSTSHIHLQLPPYLSFFAVTS